MGRPKVNIAKLKEFDASKFLEFEKFVFDNIFAEEQARKLARLEEQGGKKKKRKRR